MQSIFNRGIRKLNNLAAPYWKRWVGASRTAVIGSGKISGTHIKYYNAQTKYYTVAAVDLSAAALTATLRNYPSLRTYQSYMHMLREVKPEIVSICTWPQSHSDIVCSVAEAGVKGILCEKPLAVRLDDMDRMMEACRDAGVKLACGHQYRFHPNFRQAASIIRSGELGAIRQVSGAIRGTIANNGPHLIDTVRFVLADPAAREVRANCVRINDLVERGLPCEETATVEMDFHGDIQATLETGHADPSMFRIEVRGDKGSLIVTPSTLVVSGKSLVSGDDALGHKCRMAQFREFVDWVHDRRPDYAASAEVAQKSAELVLAAYQSIRHRTPVTLPLGNRGDVISECFVATPSDTATKQDTAAFWEFAEALPPSERPAIAGGNRSVRRWFSGTPHVGLAEWLEVTKVIHSKNLGRVGGKMVPRLETAMAQMYGIPAAVASTSGTAAIHVALGAIDPEPGDEVITTPISDMGTVIPILMSNCVPVFADVDPDSGNLTAESIEAKITPKTKAVILVHLFGRPAEIGPIVELLKARDIYLIEDCAQAHLAEYCGKKVGTWGDFGAFSFQQSKQITCGDGGITLVNRPDLATRARLFADKGWDRRSGRRHEMLGMNYRMTELQGAVALAQLRKLPTIINARRTMAERLCDRLSNEPGVRVTSTNEKAVSSWWKFPIGIDESVLGPVSDAFHDALTVEGLRLPKQYLPRPLFDEDMLRKRKTYGMSGFPITPSAYAQPDVEDYPGLAQFNRVWFPMDWSSRVRSKHIDQIALAVQKVARSLRQRPIESVRPQVRHTARAAKETVTLNS